MFIALTIVTVIALALLAINVVAAPTNAYNSKLSSYECGFTPIIGQARTPYTVGYYVVGLLYMVFDLELAILLPALISLQSMHLVGFGTLVFLIAILTTGFVYELGSGVFSNLAKRSSTVNSYTLI